ncbi:MAG: tRNA (guanosine(37)-N1)-methyltransferase TrmD [Deltaproteobacteria bacterium]|nr:tRNA (guanosine(37)-N1)-methyltransferase TrmD [Deltaproteobacteria bacterium]
MRFDILSIFPEMFSSVFNCSLLKKAQQKGLIAIHLHDIRDYADPEKHRMTDDAPYGGGGGMVMKVEPVDRALQAVNPDGKAEVVLLTPQGEPFRQSIAAEMSRYPWIIFVCGHYEGVDERIRAHLADREISIGDFVLTGGELPAMVMIDAIARLVPGVLGNADSAAGDSYSSGLLEHPQYTRPVDYRGWKVPEILLSGHHRDIVQWRRRESLQRTLERRPDLIDRAELTEEDKGILEMLKRDPAFP